MCVYGLICDALYYIKTDDLYQEMYNDKQYYDLSEVTIDKFRLYENAKVPVVFKDESNMKPITEFIKYIHLLFMGIRKGIRKLKV